MVSRNGEEENRGMRERERERGGEEEDSQPPLPLSPPKPGYKLVYLFCYFCILKICLFISFYLYNYPLPSPTYV